MRRIYWLPGSSALLRASRAAPSSRIGAIVSLTAFGLIAATTALAVPSPLLRAFDRSGVIASGGNAVKIGGPFGCPAGDNVRLRATVSQGATGAVAEGTWSATCQGHNVHWHATAVVSDGALLQAGCAHGVGLAIVRRNGRPVEASQWLSTLTLSMAHRGRAATKSC